MNFTYFKFLFINTIKRKPVWITWLLFLLTCICFLIIVPLAAKMNTLQLWSNTTMTICQSFLGMTVALFTAVLSLNIFKDGTEEGTELIVVSKPITRMKIVFTKFILFAILCLIVNLSAVIITMFTVFLPRTEPKYYWGLVISMLIGNLVAFGLFGSIACLLSAKFAKTGVIITNICLSLVFLIYQALTLFVFRTPTMAMADDYMTAPSYIVMNRKPDGSYTEEHVVKFTAAPVQKKDHPCQATNWEQMKSYWENGVLGKNPANILNATDLASQVSLSYFAYGVDDYAERQARRMFAISRYYDYDLVSPASPEIIGDHKHMNWIYVGKTEIDLREELGEDAIFYIPKNIGFAGIPPITSTRLRGYTDLIPVGYVKSKEILSQREVYLEQSQWNKYKAAFDAMYNTVFDYTHYLDLYAGETLQLKDYPILFCKKNEAVKQYYKLVWHCFKGDGPIDGALSESLECKTVDDFNDRFIQFKYYTFIKAQHEQEERLSKIDECTPDEITARNAVLPGYKTIGSALHIDYPNDTWYMRGADNCVVVEPNTQTLSWNLIEDVWASEEATIKDRGESESYQINAVLKSTKGVMDKTSAIFKTCCYPKEYYLFESVTSPARNAKYTGDAHISADYWVPYIISKYSPIYKGREEAGISVAAAQPMGQNLQYFYYTVTPKIAYWKYAVIWAVVSISLFTAGAIVYNKYDFK